MPFFSTSTPDDAAGGGIELPKGKQIEDVASTGGQPSTSTSLVGCSAHRRELEELLLQLTLIDKECVQEKLQEEKEAVKDEFIAVKREIYKGLTEMNDLIRSRYHIQLQQGNTIEVIQKGAIISTQFEQIDHKFTRMKDIFKKQVKLRGKKFTEEQLDQRFNEMQAIKQQIESSRNVFKNATIYSEKQMKTLTDVRSQFRNQGIALPAQQEWRDTTGEEQQTLDKWKERDQDIDRQVVEIGDAIDRLGEIAIQIGEKAEKQSQLVAGLHQQADETNEELLAVNNKIKELLVKQGGPNLICKLVLALILVGLLGFIISGVRKRISV